MNIEQISELEEDAMFGVLDLEQKLWLRGLPEPCCYELRLKLNAVVEDYFNVLKRRNAG